MSLDTTLIAGLLPDNTTEEISPKDLRDCFDEVARETASLEASISAGGLTQAQADARYSQINHDHNGVYEPVGTAAAAVAAALDKIFPIGTIWQCFGPENPNGSLPGTWAKIAEGRVLIGAGTLGADTYASKATGGEARHTLTTAEMPSHTHAWSTTWGSNYNSGQTITAGTAGAAQGVGTLFTGANAAAGGGAAHENRMPYLAINIWERTG